MTDVVDIFYVNQDDFKFEAHIHNSIVPIELYDDPSIEGELKNDYFIIKFNANQSSKIESLLESNDIIIRRLFDASYEDLDKDSNEEGDDAEVTRPAIQVSAYDEARRFALEGHNIFITGEGGSGKSYLSWLIYQDLVNDSKKVAMLSLTGVAAVALRNLIPPNVLSNLPQMPETHTVHSYFGITKFHLEQLKMNEPETVAHTIMHKINKLPKIKSAWLETQVAIIDEISMMSAELLDVIMIISHKLRAFNENIQFIFIGDFAQLPPIQNLNQNAGAKKPPVKYAFQSRYWNDVIGNRMFTLTTNYRLQESNNAYQRLLNRVRSGLHNDSDVNILKSMSVSRRGHTIDDYESYMHLYCTRKKVNAYNQMRMDKLKLSNPSQKTYTSKMVYVKEHIPRVPEKAISSDNAFSIRDVLHLVKTMLEDLRSTTLHVGELVEPIQEKDLMVNLDLVVGARVLLTVNIDVEAMLVNGSIGTVVGLHENYVKVQFDHLNEPTNIGFFEAKDESAPGKSKKVNYKVSIKYIPLIVAFAITIHKSQATTFEKVYIDLVSVNPDTNRISCDVFTKGMIYVALSRGRTKENTIVNGIEHCLRWIGPDDKINEFYQENDDDDHQLRNDSSYQVLGIPQRGRKRKLTSMFSTDYDKMTRTSASILLKRFRKYSDIYLAWKQKQEEEKHHRLTIKQRQIMRAHLTPSVHSRTSTTLTSEDNYSF